MCGIVPSGPWGGIRGDAPMIAGFPQRDRGERTMLAVRAPREDAPVSATAIVITVAYVIAVVIGSVIAFAIWASTRGDSPEPDTARFERREVAWLVVVLLALFALLLATIFYVPYGETAGAGKQVVKVVGVQYGWVIDPGEVVVDRPVEFWLETEGVNDEPAVQHGFGVYDPDGKLLFQAQVIPGRLQKVVHTFTTPGRYEVLCLEFCGRDHHKMISAFEVVEA
jgi:cytochrome c oxidase subunit 2